MFARSKLYVMNVFNYTDKSKNFRDTNMIRPKKFGLGWNFANLQQSFGLQKITLEPWTLTKTIKTLYYFSKTENFRIYTFLCDKQ